MNDKEIFVYPKSIYVLDAENDSLYISGFSSEAEANETAKCIGARVVNYIKEEAAQIAISELEEEVKRLQYIIIAHQVADETGYIDGEGWVEDWNGMEDEVKTLLKRNNLEQQAKGAFIVINNVLGEPESLTCEAAQWRRELIGRANQLRNQAKEQKT